MRSLLLTLLAVGAFAAPTVTLTSLGVVVGTNSAGMDNFRGIPYALPPTGSRRLRAPSAYATTYPGGTLNAAGAQSSPTACPQFQVTVQESSLPATATSLINSLPIVQEAINQGEDCLTLNVQRPQNIAAGAGLPVVVWIYGGGFESGATNQYDGANLVVNSMSINNPIIFVEMNYRINGFGFLGGSQLSSEGNTNLGLRDQRLALQWVQDNIQQFGGDPTKVTLYGESAGSISVFDQLIINNGNNAYKTGKLFRAGILSSGSVLPAQDVRSLKAQNIFNQVATTAGCPLDTNVLTCLRNLPYGTFLNAVKSVPSEFGYRGLDAAYLPRPDAADGGFFSQSPEQAILNNQYAKVPIIIGDQEDEGTLFSLVQTNITTDAQLKGYAQSYYTTATAQSVNDFIDTYPQDQSAGSPFRTGNNNVLYPQFKRLAAILGDAGFNLQRRILLSKISGTVSCWSYLASYLYNLPFLGTFHGVDVNEVFNNAPNPSVGAVLQTYFTSFIVYLDPNKISTTSTNLNWQQYTNSNPFMINFTGISNVGVAQNSQLQDTYRPTSYQSLLNNWANFKL